jgi:hypothetical protein
MRTMHDPELHCPRRQCSARHPIVILLTDVLDPIHAILQVQNAGCDTANPSIDLRYLSPLNDGPARQVAAAFCEISLNRSTRIME